MMVLRAGISTSQPSRPKRFSDDHFRCRNSSNLHGTRPPAGASHRPDATPPSHPTRSPGPPTRPAPGGPHEPGEQGPLLLVGELHDPGRLELLPDPLALLHVIDEHKLQANVLAVGVLGGQVGILQEIKKRYNCPGICNRKGSALPPSRRLQRAPSGMPNTPARAHLQAPNDLPQREDVFRAPDEGGRGQLELLI